MLYAMRGLLDDMIEYIVNHQIGWYEQYVCEHAMTVEYLPTSDTLKVTAIAPDNDGTMYVKYSRHRKFYI